MRLKSATVCNYRIHRETKVDFDPRLTLVSGPNESGKSTLVEAIHRALFLRAKTGGDVQAAMMSVWGDTPEVTLDFEAGSQAVSVSKKFRGPKGECSLNVKGEVASAGDAAEQRLAEILKVEGSIEGRGAEKVLAQRWAHLWVWQGNSGSAPTESIAEQQAALVQRLQSKGGVAVTQSDLDARVLRFIQERRDTMLTEKGKPKANSDLDKAEKDVGSLRQNLTTRQQVLQTIEEAAARYADAVRRITEKGRALVATTRELEEAERKSLQADGLKRALEPVRHNHEESAAAIAAIEKIAGDLAVARQKQAEAKAALVPCEQAAEKMRAEWDACREALRSADEARETARGLGVASSRWQKALAGHLRALDVKQTVDKLKADAKAIAARRTEISRVQAEIAATPQAETKDVTALQKCLQEVTAAEATLAALGARIEVVASTKAITVGGCPLAAGASQVITTDTEVKIAPGTLLRICPGGDTSISEARDALEKKKAVLASRLDKIGVSSVDEAATACERRKVLKSKVESIEQDLERLDAETNEVSLREAEQEYTQASRSAQSMATESGQVLPADIATTRAALRGSEEGCQKTDLAEKAAESAHKSARAKSDRAEADLQKAAADTDKLKGQLRDADVRIRTLEEQHGDDPTRMRMLLELRGKLAGAVSEQSALQAQLTVLQPEQLASDVCRLKSAKDNLQSDVNTAGQDKAAAQERLRLHGTTDPHADVVEAEARLEQAEARARELRTQADAVLYLAGLAEEAQANAARRFVGPLAEAASGYLECVFGKGAEVRLDWSAENSCFEGLQINREAARLGNFKFEALSGGTREQIGVAMRLAMAEVLAADHGGCLPIVLDDAFANSDPDRVSALQRMLYRAAERGLQVIVLTCTPADYATFGGKEVRLERPALPGIVVGEGRG